MDVRHYIAGWIGGVFGIVIGHPMDTVKTNQQISNVQLTPTQVARLILKREGIRGFYKGILFPLLSAGALNSVYFGIYSACLNGFQTKRGYEKTHATNDGYFQDNFVAGTIAGTVQAFITCPSELIKTRIQTARVIGKSQANGKTPIRRLRTFQVVNDIYKKHGISGYYVGLIPTLWRDSIHGGIYMAVYQFVRYYVHGNFEEPGLFTLMIAGASAGLASWIPVIPLDTIKSRMQADDLQSRNFKGMIDCSIDLLKKTRIQGFFKGTLMITIRAVPVNIAIINGYELVLWTLNALD